MNILSKSQASEVIDAMSSPARVSLDFPLWGSTIERVVVHERAGGVLVWQQIGGIVHGEERYSSRDEFMSTYA